MDPALYYAAKNPKSAALPRLLEQKEIEISKEKDGCTLLHKMVLNKTEVIRKCKESQILVHVDSLFGFIKNIAAYNKKYFIESNQFGRTVVEALDNLSYAITIKLARHDDNFKQQYKDNINQIIEFVKNEIRNAEINKAALFLFHPASPYKKELPRDVLGVVAKMIAKS